MVEEMVIVPTSVFQQYMKKYVINYIINIITVSSRLVILRISIIHA